MRGHFLHLRFKTFPMTPRTPQCEVFWALLSNSKHSGVPEDSKSSFFSKCWASPPHLTKVGLRQRTPLINPSKWILMYHSCSVTWTWIPGRIVLDDGGVVNVWWYHRKDHELKEIDSNDYVLFHSWYLGFGWTVVFSSSKDIVLNMPKNIVVI
jgi:hypothetical protein